MTSINTPTAPEYSVIHLAPTIEEPTLLKWIAESSLAIKDMGIESVVPGRIGRSEPLLRHAGAKVIDEPLDDAQKRGAIERIARLAIDTTASAYLCYDPALLPFAKKLRAKIHAPIIFLAFDYIEKQKKFGITLNKNLLNIADHIIVPSYALAQQLEKDWKIPYTRISIVSEGIATKTVHEEYISHERTLSLANAWSAVEDPAEIILIEAQYRSAIWKESFRSFIAEWVKAPRPNLRFVIIGDDEGSNEMQKLHSKILSKYPTAPVQFVGHCADKEAAIKLSSGVLVLKSEPKAAYPIALLAQALGRFALLPNDRSAREFVTGGENSEWIYNDANRACSVIAHHILCGEDQRATISLIVHNFINQSHTRELMHQELRAVFELI